MQSWQTLRRLNDEYVEIDFATLPTRDAISDYIETRDTEAGMNMR